LSRTHGRIDTRGDHNHVLVNCDRFTQLMRAIPLRDAKALTVSSALIDNLAAAYGIPDAVHTDNGPQFASIYDQSILCWTVMLVADLTSSSRMDDGR